MLSSRLEVRSGQAAGAFMDPLRRRLILSFVNRTRSIAEVARASGISLSLTHYHVRRLCRLGVLRVASVERRAGRPIRKYTARAQAYFIPDTLLKRGFGAALTLELDEALERREDAGEGWVAYADRDGSMRMRREPATTKQQPRLDAWKILDLDESAAVKLAEEMEMILRRFERLQRGTGQVRRFLIRCAMVERTRDRLFVP